MSKSIREYYNHLYDDTTDGYLQLVKFENKKIKIFNGDSKELREIVEEYTSENDVFITPNTMYKRQRRVANIRQFRALFQDLDIHKLG